MAQVRPFVPSAWKKGFDAARVRPLMFSVCPIPVAFASSSLGRSMGEKVRAEVDPANHGSCAASGSGAAIATLRSNKQSGALFLKPNKQLVN